MGSDHGGFQMKKELAVFIESLGHEVIDIGSYTDESVDYPIYGRAAAEKVAGGEADCAVLICGTGFGLSLAANKVRGIRCVNCTDVYTAKLSRMHNDSNALSLGARVIGIETAKMIVETWLSAEFEGGRHLPRVNMLREIEEQNIN